MHMRTGRRSDVSGHTECGLESHARAGKPIRLARSGGFDGPSIRMVSKVEKLFGKQLPLAGLATPGTKRHPTGRPCRLVWSQRSDTRSANTVRQSTLGELAGHDELQAELPK
jgi:hypothetical protein